MDIDWSKLDVGTFSWQKSLGGEAGHGMIILSPKAVDRINTYIPNWPIPKLFQLRKNDDINLDIFSGSTINTPSMICVEDFLDVLQWSREIVGLEELIRRSKDNLNIIKDWVFSSSWVDFLCEDLNNLSNTSICLKLIDPKLTTQSLETKNSIEKNTLEDLILIVFGTIVRNVPKRTNYKKLENKALGNKKILCILLDSGASASIIHSSYILRNELRKIMLHMNGVLWQVRSKPHA